LAEATLGALNQLGEQTERSRSWLVEKAIEDFVALNSWQTVKIDAGIAAANGGEFATKEEVARVRQRDFQGVSTEGAPPLSPQTRPTPL
jgi:predicted transcriptional regulator